MVVCLLLDLVLSDVDVGLISVCPVGVQEVDMCGHLVQMSCLRQRSDLRSFPSKGVVLPASDLGLKAVGLCSCLSLLG